MRASGCAAAMTARAARDGTALGAMATVTTASSSAAGPSTAAGPSAAAARQSVGCHGGSAERDGYDQDDCSRQLDISHGDLSFGYRAPASASFASVQMRGAIRAD
jgi:hypothetical protein